jgi:hypothetical protein
VLTAGCLVDVTDFGVRAFWPTGGRPIPQIGASVEVELAAVDVDRARLEVCVGRRSSRTRRRTVRAR